MGESQSDNTLTPVQSAVIETMDGLTSRWQTFASDSMPDATRKAMTVSFFMALHMSN